MQIKTEEMLGKLGYTEDWLVHGLLCLAELNEQYSKYMNNDDKNTEHYRYSTLQNWIKNKTNLSEKDWHNFLKIYDNDPDKFMMDSFLISLVQKNILSDVQLNFIEKTYGEQIGKEIHKQKIRNIIHSDNISRELIDSLVQGKNYALLREVVDITENIQLLKYISNKNISSKKINNILKGKIGAI